MDIRDGKEKIVIYQTQSQYDALDCFARQLAKGFEELGYEVYMTPKEICEQDILNLCEQKIKAFFCFNGWIAQAQKSDGVYFQDLMDGPLYCIMVDSPIHHWARVSAKLSNSHQLYIDMEHVEIARKCFRTVKSVDVMHLGGVEFYFCKEWERRTKNIVFFGSYGSTEDILDKVEKSGDELVVYAFYKMVEILLENFELTITQAFDIMMEELGLPDNAQNFGAFASVMCEVDAYIRIYVRQLIIKTIVAAGIDIDVYGNGWEHMVCENMDKLHIHGMISMEEAAEVMGDSKIVLNVMPWFKHGSHDRIFSAMLAGAVSLTDMSTWLEQEFEQEKELVSYSLDELYKLPDIIQYILTHNEEAEQIAKAGQKKARESHTWKNRAEELIQLIERDCK